jgi:hypothetical protein
MDDLIHALNILWMGMLAIFIGITVIYLIILILGHISDIKPKSKN